MDSAYAERMLQVGKRCPYRASVIATDGRRVCRLHTSVVPPVFVQAFTS